MINRLNEAKSEIAKKGKVFTNGELVGRLLDSLCALAESGDPLVSADGLGERTTTAAVSGVGTSVKRRNPHRSARPPADIDFADGEYFITPAMACGLITPLATSRIKASQGPMISLHPDDYRHLWVRPSELCLGANLGLFLEATGSGLRRGHLIAVYEGDSIDSLDISYQEALNLWNESDYVLSHPKYRYVVNGAPTCSAARANDSFGDANAFLYFNKRLRRFELRLTVDLEAGFYEILVNYTTPHQKSSFWTKEAIARLPADTQLRAREFYCS